MKMDKMAREIAEETGDFTSETGREAASKRYMPVPSVSGDTHGMDCEAGGGSGGRQPDYGAGGAGGRNDEAIRTSSQEIAAEVGVSASTIDRVRTILVEGSEEQIESLRTKNEKGTGPGVRTIYEKVQSDKLKTKLAANQGDNELNSSHPRRQQRDDDTKPDNLQLFNQDFRTLTMSDIPDNSVDLMLVLDFREPRIREDEGGKMHEQLMECASRWLKDSM
ncbi:MAG: hypothetical protein WCC17_03250 [Candidatus Nitrosopolaris sp.]